MGFMQIYLRHGLNIAGPVTTDPAVDLDLVTHLAAQQLEHWNSQSTTLQIPQGDIDARDGGHEDRASSVESQSPNELPNVLDVAVREVNKKKRCVQF